MAGRGARRRTRTTGRLASLPVLAVVVTAVISALATGLASGSTVLAHDDIAGSVPEDRSVFDEPISTASIDFGEVISDSVQMFLTFDPGGGDPIVEVGGETTKTGETTARIDFDELTIQGTYFLQYLAPVPADGHVLTGAISFTYGEPTAIDEGDNNDIRSSTPSSRQRIAEPISSAEIEFDLEITDDVTLSLVYDRGDGKNFDDLDGTTERTGPRIAVLTFDELDREGTYFVRYDATAVITGDELVGAISFTFGDPSSAESSFPILPFAAIAVPILAIGAWFTFRRMQPVDDNSDGESSKHRSDDIDASVGS